MRLINSIARRKVLGIVAGAAVVTAACLPMAAYAQDDYPNRPVEIILPFGVGGVSDIAARLISDRLQEIFGQRFLVLNVPGADGATATLQAFQGDNEGYTLLNMGNAATIRETLVPGTSPNQIHDFEPVSPVAEFGLVVVASPQSGIESVEELVATAKENPNSINIGSIAVGSGQHLAALLFRSVAGIDAEIVPYSSSPELMGAVARGEIDVALENAGGAISAIESGQVTLLATTRSVRSAVYPDVPTVEESGVAPYDVSSWNSYVSPKGIPPEVVEKLNTAIQSVLAEPEIRDRLLSFGMEPYFGGPEVVTQRIEADVAKWRAVIEQADLPIGQ